MADALPDVTRLTMDRLEEGLRRGSGRRELLGWLAAMGLGGATAGGVLLHAETALAQTPRRGGRIKLAMSGSGTQDTLDPARGSYSTDYVRGFMFYNGLTLLDGSLTPQLELAEAIETSDVTTWTIKLRSGITFHDGSPLTAADVVYTLERIKDPRTGSTARALATQMAEITATGPLEVKVVLSAPNADLPVIFGVSQFLIVKDGTTDFTTANGTGAFLCKEFKPGERSIATRNPNYWKEGKPYLDEVEVMAIADESARVNALLAGDIQVAALISHRLKRRVASNRNYAVFETAGGYYDNFIMRQDVDPTRNPDFVLAVKYLQNREQMKTALDGVVANDQPIDPTNRFYFAGLPQRPFDPDKAKFHLARSGIGNTRLPLYVIAGTGAADKAQIFQHAAQAAGLQIDLQRMPSAGYWTNVWFKHPFTMGSINPRPSADVLFTLFFKSDSPWNESGWRNERFDQLLAAARAELDEGKRRQMYADMQTIVHEQCGIGLPLFTGYNDGHVGRLKGLRPIPTGPLMGFTFAENVWLES